MKRPFEVTHLFLDSEPETRSSHGVITIVMITNKLEVDNLIHYGISLCQPGDNFCKKQGIDIALKRIYIPEKTVHIFSNVVGSSNGVVVHNQMPIKKSEVMFNILMNMYFKKPSMIFEHNWATKIVDKHLSYYTNNWSMVS